MSNNENYKCEVRLNNAATNDPCAFCGNRTDPEIPFAIFEYGTYKPVCDDCAETYNPEAVELLTQINKSVDLKKFYGGDTDESNNENKKYLCHICDNHVDEDSFHNENYDTSLFNNVYRVCDDCRRRLLLNWLRENYTNKRCAVMMACWCEDRPYIDSLIEATEKRENNIDIFVSSYFKKLNMRQYHNLYFPDSSPAGSEILKHLESAKPKGKILALSKEYIEKYDVESAFVDALILEADKFGIFIENYIKNKYNIKP